MHTHPPPTHARDTACPCVIVRARAGPPCVDGQAVPCMQMDDPSICDGGKWSKARYDDIVSKLTPFLRSCGYNPAKDFLFCPLAALSGGNVLSKPKPEVCDWWDGPTLFEALDSTEAPARDPMASFRMPVMDKYKDMGTVVMGKSESGVVQVRPSSPQRQSPVARVHSAETVCVFQRRGPARCRVPGGGNTEGVVVREAAILAVTTACSTCGGLLYGALGMRATCVMYIY